MKRHNPTIWTLAAAAVLGLSSCSKDEGDGGPGSGEVSQAVIAAFEARYPGATNVTWRVSGDYAIANFKSSAATYAATAGESNAWFENLNGEWTMTETGIAFTDLPQAVQEGFNASKYGTPAEGEASEWTLTGKVDKLERKDVMQPTADGKAVVVYVIGVCGTTADGLATTMDLYFSAEGILVNEVADATDNGYEDQLPQQPAASIEQYLQTNIIAKGGRVIEIDLEYSGTEVEAILGNRKVELFFDASQNWIYTKTDYYRSDLNGTVPANIVAAMKTSEYYTDDRRVDDIEKVETNAANGNRTWWVFELETRWDDVEVYVDDSGLIERPQIDMGESGGLPAGGDIESFINQKYPGARIVERDYDDGFLEVEIIHENIKKELTFNGRNEWIRTEWEVRLRELPEAVTQAVSREGYRFDDDEADFVETSSQSYYEVEVRKDRGEYKLRIDPQGKILHTMRD